MRDKDGRVGVSDGGSSGSGGGGGGAAVLAVVVAEWLQQRRSGCSCNGEDGSRGGSCGGRAPCSSGDKEKGNLFGFL
ncbi:hypothetical protein Syun_009637 [Stephania yunnanensis]|uniref:Uncharacterized protein n=1 Tax=Stephania yunnanensis TaxID=152371 RepID=A0AAP0PNR5_9MAGN